MFEARVEFTASVEAAEAQQHSKVEDCTTPVTPQDQQESFLALARVSPRVSVIEGRRNDEWWCRL